MTTSNQIFLVMDSCPMDGRAICRIGCEAADWPHLRRALVDGQTFDSLDFRPVFGGRR